MENKPQRFWFAVKMSFTCPKCKKLSEEVLYTSAGRPDPNPIAQAVSTQQPKCQHCKTLLTADGTNVNLNVLPVTLEQAKAAGFTPPFGAE
jgi:phage FluMu protein Com